MNDKFAFFEIFESNAHDMKYDLHFLDLYISFFFAISNVELLIEHFVQKVTSMTKSIIFNILFFKNVNSHETMKTCIFVTYYFDVVLLR